LADIYRYTDENGTIVLDRQGVPPQYVDKGYQVLNDQGRVIRTVPRAPTAEEIAQIKAEQEKRDNDERLLRLYSNPEDVNRTKQSKLREFDNLIEKTQNQITPLSEKLATLYEKLVESRRNQESADNTNLALEINILKTEQRRLQSLLVEYKAQRRKAEETFNAEQARLEKLLGLSS